MKYNTKTYEKKVL